MTAPSWILTILLLLTLLPASLSAEPFEQGKVRISLSGGMVSTYGDSYFVLGGGAGYFVLDGLELGLDGEYWFAGDPSVGKLSPRVQYFIYQLSPFVPYVGAFYKHWFVGGNYDDVDTIGGRLGAVFSIGGALYLGAGVVHEQIMSSCQTDCTDTYPELLISISL
jgi:hypothetical protein